MSSGDEGFISCGVLHEFNSFTTLPYTASQGSGASFSLAVLPNRAEPSISFPNKF